MGKTTETDVMQCFFAVKELVNSIVGTTLAESTTMRKTSLSDEDLKYVLEVVSQSLDTAIDRTSTTVHQILNS